MRGNEDDVLFVGASAGHKTNFGGMTGTREEGALTTRDPTTRGSTYFGDLHEEKYSVRVHPTSSIRRSTLALCGSFREILHAERADAVGNPS